MRSRPLAERFHEKVQRGRAHECWLWTGSTSRGYGTIYTGRSPMYAHRVAYALAHGPIPDGLFVLHRCDQPLCCNPAHLWLGTNWDNVQDCKAKGRVSQGSQHWTRREPDRWAAQQTRMRKHHGSACGRSKLTEDAVRQILLGYRDGETPLTLARQFGIARRTVYQIAHRHTWTHVTV